MQTVRARLRAATADIHESLHQAAPFRRIADGAMDRAGYGALLQGLAGYHLSMREICAAAAQTVGAPELGAAHHDRIAALEADLSVFALQAPDISALRSSDPDFSVGCLYVVQGSTLGGKVIFRQLDALLEDEGGRSFFKGTIDDGALWQRLCKLLESVGQGKQYPSVEAGARHAFVHFGSLLSAV